MRVTVTFYARLAELAGRRECPLEVADGATVGDVWHASVLAYAGLAPMSGRVSSAVNAEFAPLTAVVDEGDEIAFLPPVSGGGEGR